METEVNKLYALGRLMSEHGTDFIRALLLIIFGLLLTKWIIKILKIFLAKTIKSTATVSIVANGVGIILVELIIVAAALEMGAKIGPLITFLMVVGLVLVSILIAFRPLLPTLPFKVGNTVQIGNLFGKVEATTILNTRVRTFFGQTLFVPNKQILNEIVINLNYTETRRIKLNVTIRYDQNLIKAKQCIEAIMMGDPRVQPKPAPVVYVLNLGENGVKIGGRCWVKNTKYWVTRCELTEKIKYRFYHEKILFAYPQLDVHHYQENVLSCNGESENNLLYKE
jgi:small conductance mechanosensitive channel